jgi:hypothetical protein
MMKPICVLTLGALVVGCHLDKLVSGSGGPHPTSTAPPVALVFMTKPQNTQVGQKINPAVQVSVVDSAGVPVSGADTTTVVIQLGANPPGNATLGGTTSAHPNRGVATFGNLWIDKAGDGYTLKAHVSGLPDTTSQPFNITPPPDTTGSITVTTSTTGLDLDLDGYTVTVDGTTSQSIATNSGSQGVTFPGLSVGNHGVVLSSVAANCSVTGGNSRTASVTAGQTTTIAFSVTCTAIPPTTGDLTVTTSTSGSDLDPDGYTVAVDQGAGQSIATNSTTGVKFTNLPAGNHSVVLSDVAANCTVSGGTTHTVAVTAGGNTPAPFVVTCTAIPPTTGSVVVTTATTGSSLPTGPYTVTLDGGSGQSIGINGNYTFGDVSAGNHTVALSGVPSNCTVSPGTSQTVAVSAGASATAPFAISCVTPPPVDQPPVVSAGGNQTVLFGSVTVNWSFTDPDNDAPWTYSIDWDDGSSPQTGTTSTQGARSATHSYGLNLLGTHNVRVTVTDNHGLSGSDTAVITVVASLAPPSGH